MRFDAEAVGISGLCTVPPHPFKEALGHDPVGSQQSLPPSPIENYLGLFMVVRIVGAELFPMRVIEVPVQTTLREAES